MTLEEAFEKLTNAAPSVIIAVKQEIATYKRKVESKIYIDYKPQLFEFWWSESFDTMEEAVADVINRIENKIYFIEEPKE